MKDVIEEKDIIRMKGFVDVKGKKMRIVVKEVGKSIENYLERKWGKDEKR